MTGGVAAGVQRPAAQALWELRRGARALTRRFGVSGWVLLGCVACAVLALAAERRLALQANVLEARLAAQLAANASRPQAAATLPPQDGGARARLRAFDDQLLAHQDIPFVVKHLLEIGEGEGLSMQRGAYRPQADAPGGFLRYRMTFPVKGSGPAIQRFINTALRKQHNLALDSVQFKRARIGSTEIEARIHWVMLTRLPGTGSGALR